MSQESHQLNDLSCRFVLIFVRAYPEHSNSAHLNMLCIFGAFPLSKPVHIGNKTCHCLAETILHLRNPIALALTFP